MKKNKIINLVAVLCITAVFTLQKNTVIAQKNDQYEIAKHAYFQPVMEELSVYWVEECYNAVGNQCTTPGAAFRTKVATFKLLEFDPNKQ